MRFTDRDIWKNDFVTRQYKKEQGEILNAPEKMSAKDLANACTYCNSWGNPYSEETVKRAGKTEEYVAEKEEKRRKEIIRESYQKFGIQIF